MILCLLEIISVLDAKGIGIPPGRLFYKSPAGCRLAGSDHELL